MRGISILGVVAVGVLATIGSATADAGPADNELRAECVKAGLVMPVVVHARMHHPGRKHNPRIQAVDIKVRFAALPSECSGEYRRISQVRVQLQDPKRRKHWFRLEPGLKWRDVFSWDPTTQTGGNKAGVGGANISSNGHEGSNVFYRCSKGKRKTRARAFYRNQVKDLSTGRIIGQNFMKRSITIDGGGC